MYPDTRSLVDRAAAGDAEAVGVLLDRYLPRLRAFVRLRTPAELRANESNSDLVQSTCREILTHMDRFRHPSESAFRHWLFTTAQRKISNRMRHYRAAKRGPGRLDARPGGGDPRRDALLLACYSSFSTPSGKLALKEEVERVEAAIDALPDDYREVITLAHVAGLPRSEIAERMGRSEGSVRVLLHRALARLAILLEARPDT